MINYQITYWDKFALKQCILIANNLTDAVKNFEIVFKIDQTFIKLVIVI